MGYIPGCDCGSCTAEAKRRRSVPPVVKTPIIPLDPVKSPDASNTFYALFGTEGGGYVQGDGYSYKNDVSLARQFGSMNDVLRFLDYAVRYLSPFEIRRITRSTTPGTTSRRVLDHGEQAPVGAKVKFGVVNLYTVERGRLQQALENSAGLHVSEIGANTARPNMSDTGWGVRRVIETVTEPKVTYKEEVVQ